MIDYKYNLYTNRYKILKYDMENGAIMPTHKKAELDRYERYFAERHIDKHFNAEEKKELLEM